MSTETSQPSETEILHAADKSDSTSPPVSSVVDKKELLDNEAPISDAAGENGGYASGDEVFETAPEGLPIDNSIEEEEIGGVKGSNSSVATTEEKIENSKGGANGVSSNDLVKTTSKGDAIVEKVQVDAVEPGVAVVVPSNQMAREEPTDVAEKIPEKNADEATVEGGNVTREGDAIIEKVQVGAAEPGVVVVGDADKSILESPIDEIPVDNGFDVLSDRKPKSLESKAEIALDSNGIKADKPENVAETGAVGAPDGEVKAENKAVEAVSSNDSTAVETENAAETGAAGASDGEIKAESKAVEAVSSKDSTAVETENVEESGDVRALDGEITGDNKAVEAVSSRDPTAVETENVEESVAVSAPVGEIGAESKAIESVDIKDTASEDKNEEEAKKFIEEVERENDVEQIDGQIVTDSEEEDDTEEEGESKELFDSSALAALLAATGAEPDDSISITSQDGSRLFSVERPAGLGSSLRSFKPASRPTRPNLFSSSALAGSGPTEPNITEEERKKLEGLQQLRVKFLRLMRRLNQSSEEATASQVLYRLALLAGRQTNQIFNLEAAKAKALQLEEANEDLEFSLNILVIGKTGVGKSATINSLFGGSKTQIDAYEPATSSVKEITGVVDGVKIRVIDTPGLKPAGAEQNTNRKILASVKKLLKKFPLDIILYVDRLDTQTRDLNDMPLLRTVTNALGASVWRSAIVALTHAASAPPDGPSGNPLSYEVFVAQRSHVVQQSIGQACGDLRLMNPTLMNPVSLVENHPSCRKNRDGQKVLPNGQAWRSQMLLLCYSVKILSEASNLTRSQEQFDHKKLFGFRVRSPPLPYLLSWLLQSRTHPKAATDQGVDIDSDIDFADLSDNEMDVEDDEYEQLPPFKPLKRKQLEKLTGEQKKAYFEEYDYRVKLLQKKQWKEEVRRMKEIKKKGRAAVAEENEDGEQSPAAVPVPLPDMILPPTFDGDSPGYRYRFLEPNSQFLARPVLDSHGWDHDCGYDGVNIEHALSIMERFPATVAVQMTKDKKEFNLHLDSSVAAKHNEYASSMAGFDIQNVGKQLAYIVRAETKVKNMRNNKTGAGMSVTFLGRSVATGVKVEDQISLGKRWTLVGSTGVVRAKGDAAYGANLEVRLKDGDFPVVQDQSSLGLSLVKWRGDLAVGANLQSQVSVGRGSKVAVRAGLNNKMSGQITVKISSSEQLQIALAGLLPVVMTIFKAVRPVSGEGYPVY